MFKSATKSEGSRISKEDNVIKSAASRVLLTLVPILLAIGLVPAEAGWGPPAGTPLAEARNVIFIHPDGANQQHFHAFRLVDQGPGGDINWDRLPQVALYRPHVLDALQAGSVAGAVAHAAGIKTYFNWFGFDRYGQRITTITQLAQDAGVATGLINSGNLTEPGTAVFVASAERRGDREYIMLQVAESGVDVILGGGERYFLPAGVQGRHGMGRRADGRNLIDEMKAEGYTVVFTREELAAVNPAETDRLLGLFAHGHTFNDRTEEYLAEHNLPLYWPWAPCVGEMTDKAISILSRKQTGFFLVVEEEGTDNFADGVNNAKGTIEAVRRADRAIGVAMDFAEAQGNTLVITAADSDAGGMNILPVPPGVMELLGGIMPATMAALEGIVRAPVGRSGQPYVNLASIDGRYGTETPPFTTPSGMQFGIAWAGQADFATTMIARAYGPQSHLVTGVIDNTDIFYIMLEALQPALFTTPPAAAVRPSETRWGGLWPGASCLLQAEPGRWSVLQTQCMAVP